MNGPVVNPRRRSFLSGLAVIPSALVSPPSLSNGSPTGELIITGVRPELLPSSGALDKHGASVLSRLDLCSGRQISQSIPVPYGVAALGVGNGQVLFVGQNERAVVVDAQGALAHESVAPMGYRFSGGVSLSEAHAILTMSPNSSGLGAEIGLLRRISLNNLDQSLPDSPSHGVGPRCLAMLSQTNELLILDSGQSPFEQFASTGQPFVPGQASIIVVDADQLTFKRRIAVSQIEGNPTCMVATDSDTVFIGVSQTQKISSLGGAGQSPSLVVDPIQYSALFKGTTPTLQPLLRVSLKSGVVDAIAHARGFEAMALNGQTGVLAAAFSDSDQVVFATKDGLVKTVDAAEIGLSNVSGVVEIPGTSLLCLSGSNRYVVLIDTTTYKVVSRYRTENYGARDLSFVSSTKGGVNVAV